MAFGLSAGAAALVGAVAAPVIGGLINGGSNRAAERANNTAADATALQSQIAAEQWDKYRELYEPLERNVISEAQNYDTPQNYARAAGEASAAVSDQFGKARDRMTRTPGLDPSQAAFQSSMVGLDLAQAASDATQQNAARTKVRDTAFARKTDALGLGKGLPAGASSQLASVAQQGYNQANYNRQIGLDTVGAVGRITDRVFNGGLGGSAPVVPAAAVNFGTGYEYGNQDYGAFV